MRRISVASIGFVSLSNRLTSICLRGGDLVAAEAVRHLSGEGDVEPVAGLYGNYISRRQRTRTGKRKVTDQVEEFVPGQFIVEAQGRRVAVRIDNEGIVKRAAAGEPRRPERLHLLD